MGTPETVKLPAAVRIYSGGFVLNVRRGGLGRTDCCSRESSHHAPLRPYADGTTGHTLYPLASTIASVPLGGPGARRQRGVHIDSLPRFQLQDAGSQCRPSDFLSLQCDRRPLLQIMESGLGNALPLFNASQREPAWAPLQRTSPGARAPSRAQNATTEEITSALAAADALIPSGLLFPPAIDCPVAHP